MSDQDALINATFWALGVEGPNWVYADLPQVAAEVAARAKKFEARYIGVRAALDGLQDSELHERLLHVARRMRAKADGLEMQIRSGELTGDQRNVALGKAHAYYTAANLVEINMTVIFGTDEITGAWKKEGRVEL